MSESQQKIRTDLNSISVIGNVGPRREGDYSEGGSTPRLRVSIANNRAAGKGDTLRQETTWFTVVIFGNSATNLNKVLTKGYRIAVKGHIQAGRSQRVRTVGNGEREFNSHEFEIIPDMRDGVQLLGPPRGQVQDDSAPAEPAVAATSDDQPF